jgi:5-methylcytosine-specific restriction endonuclease McrA
MSNKNGMNWIRQEKRLAIYLRDGLHCAYCSRTIESDNITLTLDHLITRSNNGSNHESNLITACHDCNAKRGDMDVSAFVFANCKQPETVLVWIEQQRMKPLNMAETKRIIARRKMKEC